MRLSFEQSAETRRIVAFLTELPVNVPTSFADLEKAVGRHKRSALYSAIRVVRKKGVVVASIRGFGFQRITAAETVARQDSHLRSIRRKAGVIQTEVESAIRGNLSPKDQMRATQIHAAAGVIRSAATVSQSNAPKVEAPAFLTPRDLK